MRKREKKYVGFTKLILENRYYSGGNTMRYVEMTLEEAVKECNKNTKVLVAMQNLAEKDDSDVIFIPKKREEYTKMFEDVKTAASLCNDFVRQLNLFTERQDIRNIKPQGFQKIVLLRE